MLKWQRKDKARISNAEFSDLAAKLSAVFRNWKIMEASAAARGLEDNSPDKYEGGLVSVFCTANPADHIVLQRDSTAQIIQMIHAQGVTKNLENVMTRLEYEIVQ